MTCFRVSFDRIGRTRDADDLVASVRDIDGRPDTAQLTDAVGDYARRYLMSPCFDVATEYDHAARIGSGLIMCGFHVGATFTFKPEPGGQGTTATATIVDEIQDIPADHFTKDETR